MPNAHSRAVDPPIEDDSGVAQWSVVPQSGDPPGGEQPAQANRFGLRRVPVGMKRWRIGREHRFSQSHLPAMLDDELTTRQRRRLRAHADDCPECGPVLLDLLRFRRILLGLGRSVGADSARADGILQYLRTATVIDAQRPGSAS